MSEGCNVLSEVLIELAADPSVPVYICAFSCGNPAMCTTSFAYSRLLQDPSFKALNKKASEKGCKIAVQAGKKIYRIAIIEGAAPQVDFAVNKAKTTYKAFDCWSGIHWLTQYLATI